MLRAKALLALVVVAVCLSGCNGQFPVVSPVAIGDLTAAICTELEANPSTDVPFVQMACSFANKSGEKQTVLVLVPKENAAAFKAARSGAK